MPVFFLDRLLECFFLANYMIIIYIIHWRAYCKNLNSCFLFKSFQYQSWLIFFPVIILLKLINYFRLNICTFSFIKPYLFDKFIQKKIADKICLILTFLVTFSIQMWNSTMCYDGTINNTHTHKENLLSLSVAIRIHKKIFYICFIINSIYDQT